LPCRRSISIEATSCPKCGQPLEDGWGAKAKSQRVRNASIGWGIFAGIFVLLVSAVVYGNLVDEANSRSISADQYAEDWPFSRSAGTLSCIDATPGGVRRPYVIVEFDGVKYGLNGAAKGVGNYLPADAATKRDAHGLFTIGDVRRLIEEGLELCKLSY
jgi:hypothetical protein